MRYRGYGSSGLGIVGYIIITCVALWIPVSLTYKRLDPGFIGLVQFVPNDLLQMRQPTSHPWSILTSIFIHAPLQVNFYHILFNMLVLYFFGNFLVNLVGGKKFLLVFLTGALVGNLFF